MQTQNKESSYSIQLSKFSIKNHWLVISTLGGLGLSRIAPGTLGSLVTAIVAYFLFPLLSFNVILLIGILLFVLGWIASSQTQKIYGVKDPSSVIIDEVVAIWFVLATVFQSWEWFLIAFIIFRIFDIVKPYPINAIEEKFDSGLGIMLDDILAAVYSIILLLIIDGLVNFLSY